MEWLRRVVAFIDGRRRVGVTTYVHYMAGMNRNGMVVQVQPNPTLMRLLAEWEETLKETGP